MGRIGKARRALAGALLAIALAVFANGCAGTMDGASLESAGSLPSGWQSLAYEAIKTQFPEGDPKVFFLGQPHPASVRYRYWTEKRLIGHAGAAALKAKDGRGRVLGPDGPWFVLYVLDSSGQALLVTDNLEAADVEPPVYAMEVVDQTKSVEIRLPRPLDLSRAGFRRLGEFSRTPWEALPNFQ
ncbi:MAG: hypothetical protein LBE49_03630 [Deltaproteobacteria bacterium]|jgi:hypothetical protein|nr:hypothetical protein [Deltaproteobacteria bacterium]